MTTLADATIRIIGSHGADGLSGIDGENGVQPADPNGKDGSCKSRWFGTDCTCSESGKPGGNAPTVGYPGHHGTPGAPAPSFTLNVGTVEGALIIFSQGGHGGKGGDGGDGGKGADGGNAGQFNESCGTKCLDGDCDFALGGTGGNGSNAGDGGHGGDGGDGGPITVFYRKMETQLIAQSQGGLPGSFGKAGQFGPGGRGGLNEVYPGQEPNSAADGINGSPGTSGKSGQSGDNGTVLVRQA